MGSEVHLRSDCMFDGVCIRTLPDIQRGETFYIGRLNMLNMKNWGCRKTNKGETLINMGSEVDLPPRSMFDGACIRTVAYI